MTCRCGFIRGGAWFCCERERSRAVDDDVTPDGFTSPEDNGLIPPDEDSMDIP